MAKRSGRKQCLKPNKLRRTTTNKINKARLEEEIIDKSDTEDKSSVVEERDKTIIIEIETQQEIQQAERDDTDLEAFQQN
eukprot:12073067-Heterocapsa_arctica.AAC.1